MESSRISMAYRSGDRDRAIALAREQEGKVWHAFAERLASRRSETRLQLNVPFVRQHHVTCAPATLAMLSQFWGKPAEHLAIAEEICFGGTLSHRQRQWAERNGWLTREFTVTPESTRALITRGIPFALSTAETTSGHLQAVVGFDDCQQTIRLRDPYLHYARDIDAASFFIRYASCGPRGLALVPVERAELMLGLELPDATLYDALHELNLALEKNDGAAAGECLSRLRTASPEHRITIEAEWFVAAHDQNDIEILRHLERLGARFPEARRWQLIKLQHLRGTDSRDERLAVLEQLCGQRHPEPVFLHLLASELAADARLLPRAKELYRRALWQAGGGAGLFLAMADVFHRENNPGAALELNRYAACLDEISEGAATAYFAMARREQRTEEALRVLRGRVERLGRRTTRPALTLSHALRELAQHSEAARVVEHSLEFCPNDPDALMTLAQWRLNEGNVGEAERGIEQLRPHVPAAVLLRFEARLAEARGELQGAMEKWRSLADVQRSDVTVQENYLRLLDKLEGRGAVLRHLGELCAAMPHAVGLHQLWLRWAALDGAVMAEPVARRIAEISPRDPNARRELGRLLIQLRRLPEAEAELALAEEMDPTHPETPALRGWIRRLEGKRHDAQAFCRQSIHRSIDLGWVMRQLLDCSETILEERRTVEFLRHELIERVIFGDGLLDFVVVARGVLGDSELLTVLREAIEKRPELWQSWSAVIEQLLIMDRLAEAAQTAERAVQRHPSVAWLWRNFARIHRLRSDSRSEMKALERVNELEPGAGAIFDLADALLRENKKSEALELARAAAAGRTDDAALRVVLAHVLWRADEKKTAVERLQEALRMDPDRDTEWQALHYWTRELELPDAPLQLARDLTTRFPGDTSCWLRLAKMLDASAQQDERAAAIGRALAAHPRCVAAHTLRAFDLFNAGRIEEAKAACADPIWAGSPPAELRARAASFNQDPRRARESLEIYQTVLAENSSLFWVWGDLADLHYQLGEKVAAKETLERFARQFPKAGEPHVFLGNFHRREGDNPAACECFEKAVKVAPGDYGAVISLLELQIATNQFGAMKETLELARGHGAEDWVLSAEIAAFAAKRDASRAFKALREFAALSWAGRETVNLAVRAFIRAGWQMEVVNLITEFINKEEAPPAFGAWWTSLKFEQRQPPGIFTINRVARQGTLGQEAAAQYLYTASDVITEAKLHGRRARWWRFRLRIVMMCNSSRLDQKLGGRHAVVQALFDMGHYRGVCRRMARWQHLAEITGGMLTRYAAALRACGRFAQAAPILERAAAHRTNDAGGILFVMRSMDSVLAVDADEVERALQESATVHPAWTPMLQLGQHAIALRASPANYSPRAQEVFAEFSRSVGRMIPRSCRWVRRELFRLIGAFAQSGGGWRARVWGFRKCWLRF
jgi:cellulose synthase operon protein C